MSMTNHEREYLAQQNVETLISLREQLYKIQQEVKLRQAYTEELFNHLIECEQVILHGEIPSNALVDFLKAIKHSNTEPVGIDQ
jgi:hypothetical protein